MENTSVHYTKIHYTSSEEEYNRYADAGWRYIHFDVIEDHGDTVTRMIVGWPESAGEPVYPQSRVKSFV